VNFPQVQLPSRPSGTRFIQVHENVPGQISRLNDIFSRRGINISAQYFQTDGHIGYVVLEADGAVEDARGVLREIRALPGTIRARMLYRRD
jgi:D-3-phosphoglycerate dehydrogenase